MALNKQGHIFLLNRGNHPLLEFNPDGSFVKSLGEGSPIFHAAHSVRFDGEDNMWIVDSANNVIVKFTPKRRIVRTLGRREESPGSTSPTASNGRSPARRISISRPTPRSDRTAAPTSPTATATHASPNSPAKGRW